MKKAPKFIILFLCIMLACVSATGCGAPKGDAPPANEGQAQDGQGAEDIDQKIPMSALYGHEMPLEGNPVAGEYITTSGVKMGVGEDGSYIWDETDVEGELLTGKYTLYEGTVAEHEDGTTGYVTESDTGLLYTLYIEFDTNGADGIVPFTIQVFDTYDEYTFLVTDLVYGIEFEAVDVLISGQNQGLWYMEQMESLTLEEADGPSIIASWDELPGADGYKIAVLPISFEDFDNAVFNDEYIPDAVFQGGTEETTITVSEGLSSGETYTVCVVGMKDGVASLGAYKGITLK